MAKQSTKNAAKAKSDLPGFPGEAPAQEGWFATNHLCFKGGILHQLHKGQGENNLTVWHWFPVKSVD